MSEPRSEAKLLPPWFPVYSSGSAISAFHFQLPRGSYTGVSPSHGSQSYSSHRQTQQKKSMPYCPESHSPSMSLAKRGLSFSKHVPAQSIIGLSLGQIGNMLQLRSSK